MSAGPFQYSRYSADAGGIYRIRVQAETLALNIGGANNPPGGTINQAGTVRARGSRRSFGIVARAFSIRFTGTPPSGYAASSTLVVPILTKATWDNANLGDSGTYLGASCQLVGKIPESAR